MTTTTPAIDWYYGPTAWNPNSHAMWHTGCPDLVGAGHVGEVFLWKDGTASCTGCALGTAATARDRLRAFVTNSTGSSDVLADDLETLIDAVVTEESRTGLLAVQTRDGRVYHPDDVTFIVVSRD